MSLILGEKVFTGWKLTKRLSIPVKQEQYLECILK